MLEMHQALTIGNGSVFARRKLLEAGALGFGGLTLSQLLAEETSKRRRAANDGGIKTRADAAIVIYLNGGPSHHDMWDMKPEAPSEIRGEFRPIASSLPSVPFCELLPRTARLVHRATLVRSMHHSVNNAHAAAVYTALTGHDRGEQGGGAKPTDYPPPGAVLDQLRPPEKNALPYIALPYKTQEGRGGPLQPGFLAGFIGRQYDPFWVLQDPNGDDFHVPNLTLVSGLSSDRVKRRRRLLSRLDTSFGDIPSTSEASLQSMDQFQHRAFDLLTSSDTQRAFRIDEEPEKVRDSYGRNIYGQSVLLARRLIEAGTRLVNITWAPDANATWDTHTNNFKRLRNALLPNFDAACSSLVTELAERGMLERTLVAVLGDFGRTPRVNKQAGRDHWNNCYTVMLIGGGIRAGFVRGASDRIGALPTVSPTTPGDLVATLYHLFGIDPKRMIYDNLNRPHPLIPHGRIVRELLA